MTDYYKALRPDGTDFATGSTKPRKGWWMPRIDGDLVMCERGYHVSDAIAETLIGGSWPCKLARVEIPDGDWQRESHKLLVPTYRVVEWLPAWQALGPNGQAVEALIEQARNLTPPNAATRSAAWSAAREAAWVAARVAAREAARVSARVAALEAALEAARVSARVAALEAAREAAWVAARVAAREAARVSARDAARALVVRDLITPAEFDTLYAPWAATMATISSGGTARDTRPRRL